MNSIDTLLPSTKVFERQFELLKLELTLIDSAIRSHDEITKNVKQWGIVAWSGAVGLTLGDPLLKPTIWATAFLPLVFWLLDGSFRRVQRTFIVRNQDISHFINSGAFIAAAQSETRFEFPLMKMRDKKGRKTSWWTVMTFWTVWPLYALMMFASLVIGTLVRLGRV